LVEDLFAEAVELPPGERHSFLEAAQVDEAVRAEVRALLGADRGSGKLREVVAAALADVGRPSQRLAGRFTVRGTLGVGGMGVVLEAHDEVRRELVALKTLDRMDPQGIYDLKREFRTLADVVHPRLVRLHELFSDGDRWFFSMQRLHGVPFVEHVRRDAQLAAAATQPAPAEPPAPSPRSGGRLDEPALRSALRDLVDGVRAIHRAGQLHRDLKPSNVLVCDGRAVILDFGLARPLAHAARSTELAGAGTPAYMAPEQIDAGGASAASDWYAVGAMLYEALTGRWPYTGTLRQILAAKTRGERPADPRAIDPRAPADLSALAMALLAADPEVRPAEAAIVAAVGAPAALRSAYQSRPSVVRIEGTSGIGKTALVDHFLAELGAEPMILRGRCYERESVPFKVLDEVVDALSRQLARLGPLASAKLTPRHAGELCRVFPVLARLPAFADESVPAGLGSTELRRRAFDAFHEMLARIADRQPVVIAIDDVQWGDADSRGALAQLLERSGPARVLWVLGHRTGEDHGGFVRGLDALTSADGSVTTSVITLAPLDAEQAKQLARARAAHLDDAAIDEIARESAGSPFFIDELVRGRRLSDGQRESLAERIRARIAARSPEAVRLMELVALAGRPVPLAAVLAAAGATGDAAIPELRAGSLVRLLGGADEPMVDTYHDRTRESVAEAIGPAARARGHLALAEALEACRGPRVSAELLALHFRGAGVTEKARTYTVEAAQVATSAFAFERAAELFEIALELTGDAGARRNLERAYADALAGCGRGEDAAAAYLRAASGASDDEAIDLEASAAYQLLATGHQARGHELGRRVMARVGVWIPASVFASFVLALIYWLWHFLRGFPLHPRTPRTDSPEALRRFDLLWALYEGLVMNETLRSFYFGMLAVSHARALSDPERRSKVLGVLASLLPGMRGAIDRRSAIWAEQQRALAAESGLPRAAATASRNEGLRLYTVGDWSAAGHAFARARDLLEDAGGSITDRMTMQSGMTGTHYYLGELVAYGELSRQLVGEAQRIHNRSMVTTHVMGSSVLSLLADDADTARRELAASSPSRAESFHLPGHFNCAARAVVALYTGDVEAVRAYLVERAPDYRRARLFAIHFVRCEWSWYRSLLALRAADAAATPAEARQLRREAARFGRTLEKSRIPTFAALGMVVRAALLAHAGGDARPDLEEACRRLDACSTAAFAASARWQLGQLCGDEAGAAHTRAAEDYFRSQGVVRPERLAQVFAPRFPR
jgi:hypothetical protein